MATTPRTLRLVDHLRPGAFFYLERQCQQVPASGAVVALHRHDFLEIFWIEAGHGIERRAAGEHALAPGDLVLLRAEDAHAFTGAPGSRLVLWNLAFPGSVWKELLHRHLGELRDIFAPGALRRHHLDAAALGRAIDWARTATASRRRIDLERLLLELELLLVQTPTGDSLPAPRWLRPALEALREPRWFRLGTRALVALSGCSAEHVARTLRRYCDRTPTDLVTAARLDWAAEQLAANARPILAIALDCGWQRLGTFYRRFGQRFGTTPLRWRMRARRMAGAAQ